MIKPLPVVSALLNKEKSYDNIDPGTLFISLLKSNFCANTITLEAHTLAAE
jgi:hypothetical protein